MNTDNPLPEHSWAAKFRNAFRGVKEGVRGQSSFFVHLFIAAAVIAAAVVLDADLAEWCVLLLCIAIVLSAEMFNSALESLAKGITDQWNPHVGRALDMGSGAVLIASVGAATVGVIIFVNRLRLMDWW